MTSAGRSSRNPAAAVRSIGELSLRLLRQWWLHLAALAAACGIVAATIAGAIGVGEALTRSLRRLALARLGGIEAAVLADGFFRAELAEETASRLRSQAGCTAVGAIVPAVVIEVSLEAAGKNGRRAASSRATLLATAAPQSLGFPVATESPAADTAVINRQLADSLGVRAGDAVVLRIANEGSVPSDSPLGRRTAASWSRRLRVADVLPAGGLGDFSLRPTQVTGGLVVVSPATVEAIMRWDGPRANAMLAVRDALEGGGRGQGIEQCLRSAVEPALEDLGLVLDAPAGSRAWRLSSRRLLLQPEADRAAAAVLGPLGGRPTLVFLATTMAPARPGGTGPASIPYSTVVGIDHGRLPVGELIDDDGQTLAAPGPEEIVIDRWMADDLAAQGSPVAVGDPLEVGFFLPETLHGRVEESRCTLRISGIAAMEGAAVARSLVPEVEGITDEASIADWDPPFPFDRSRVRTTPPHDEDDRYWKEHGATPKAFVALATARRLAGSRFGATTAWHVPAENVPDAAPLRRAVAAAVRPESLGIRVVALRAQAAAAARGSTPFGGLFLALSSFVVVAGLILEWLLFSLLVAARRRDIGILAAVGWPPGRIALLLACVGAAAAVAGILVGTVLGPLWAGLLLRWLASAWDTAVVAGSSGAFAPGATPLSAVVKQSLLPAAAATAVSLAAVVAAAWRAARQPPLVLLRSAGGELTLVSATGGRATVGVAVVGPLVSLMMAWWANRVDAQAAVGLFFGAGAAALAGLLAALRMLLAAGGTRTGGPLRSLPGLAWRGLAHGRSRGFAVAAIVASAEFLIVAVSSFALHPPARPQDRDGPTGGWTFLATFASPSGIDPADPVAREALGLSDADRDLLSGCTIARIRSSAGDDASCVNLYAAAEPTVLGLGPSFIDRGGFRFVDHRPLPATADPGSANPWMLLVPPEEPEPAAIPVIIDQATAQWALKLGGVGSRFRLPVGGGSAECEIVGLLEPGILQGMLLVSEKSFQRLFPQRSGYSLALVDAGAKGDGASDRVSGAIAAAWADAGPKVTRTIDRLRSLQAVQNTFLAGFQTLGTLGLGLGVAGVAAVQFQGVLERLGTLGLLSAIGFTVTRLRLLILLETLTMLLLGLLAGTFAGCLAVAPALLAGRADAPVGWIAFTWCLTLTAAVAAGLVATRPLARLDPGRLLAQSDR